MHLFCVQVVPLHLSQMQFYCMQCRKDEEYGVTITPKVKAIGVKAAA